MQLRNLTEERLVPKILKFNLLDKWIEAKAEKEETVERMEDSKGMIEEEEVAVEVALEAMDNTEKNLTQEEDFKVTTMIVEVEEEEVDEEVVLETEEALRKMALVEEEEVEVRWNALNVKESAICLRTAQEEKQNQ